MFRLLSPSKFILLFLAQLLVLLSQQVRAPVPAKAQFLEAAGDTVSFQEPGLPGRGWIAPSVKTQGVILAIHGLSLNSGSYESFGNEMALRGLPTFAIDVRGFGKWNQNGTHTNLDLTNTVQDVHKAILSIKQHFAGAPVFLVGESMGGAVAITAAAQKPDFIAGVIASVPSGERFEEKKVKLKVGTKYLLNPKQQLDVTSQVVNKSVSNEEIRRLWLDDPLNRLHLSAKELLQFQKFMDSGIKHARLLDKVPVLIVQGCRDNLVKPQGTIALYNQVATQDKHLILIGHAEHLVFQKGQFSRPSIDMVVGWMNSLVLKSHD